MTAAPTALAALTGVILLVLLLRGALLRLPAGWLPRPVRPAREGTLAVEQVLPLDPRRRLVLVRCEGRRLLLLIGGGQDVALGWLEPPA